ncbi:protein-L-isoaspartate O-methyltransferase family protein [Corynebacterium halotolerans]|uniref:protein-L-isoaspartate O-methyltransferase family protein n=1 Tax=Corynebacterium halotolerans TaxID=225326 RepID=UPI003CF39D5B
MDFTAPHIGDGIEEAMARHPRTRFLPADQAPYAAENRALPIGYGQTNSQPSTVADMLRLLDLAPGQRVLDVGSGSGWTSAILGELVGESGQVLGVELVPELVAAAREALGDAQPWVSITQATPGTLGLPDQAPFDRILVSAAADELPTALVEQLAGDGVMVIPVDRQLLRVTRDGTTGHGGYVFVPLITS